MLHPILRRKSCSSIIKNLLSLAEGEDYGEGDLTSRNKTSVQHFSLSEPVLHSACFSYAKNVGLALLSMHDNWFVILSMDAKKVGLALLSMHDNWFVILSMEVMSIAPVKGFVSWRPYLTCTSTPVISSPFSLSLRAR